jgi:hypothetical protein
MLNAGNDMTTSHKTRSGQVVLLLGVLCLGVLTLPSLARADVITDVNSQLLNIIQNTSGSLVDGPPEVANEIMLVDTAMYDAVNAASNSPFQSANYTGGSVQGANASAAALQAAVTVMNNLYINPTTSLYQQYAGVTGATYYGATSPYKGTLVGPTTTQMTAVASDVTTLQNELNTINTSLSSNTTSVSASLGNAAAAAAIAVNNASGSQAAMLATLTPYTNSNSGPGAYVPPATRPALQPTWGGVTPTGISSSQLNTVVSAVPGQQPLTSQAYALELLQTECEGASSNISSIEATCQANGFVSEDATHATAALFWNDPGTTAQPPGHWLQIADNVAASQNLSLLQHARADALVGIALEDAGIATWGVKFDNANSNATPSWRPITAITYDASQENCGGWSSYFTTCLSSWTSLIATPPHPDYIAGHPAFSGAAATALEAALGTDNVTFSSSSQNYCNGGTTTFDADGNVIACTLNSVTYTLAGAGCAGGGTAVYDSDSNLTGCTLGGADESVTGGNCNNSGSEAVLNSDGTVNALYNASPLICSIGETFTSITEASSGDLGAEFSRVVGGIHTPQAVTDALALGNSIGGLVGSEDLIPEPPMAPVVAGALVILGIVRRRRAARAGATV